VFNETEDFEKYLEICKRYKESHGFKHRWRKFSSPDSEATGRI
jgi:hypothetical protein